ncbi:hypothetical protein [Pelagibacterium montanilacus]|uniref:hypothetical protein n=1 Tax=Pelagibacterium montanilacus TaxID=2185280 RepID=UPI0013DF658D|nr:hypothetical protein [Pelagibacterium montanilacus]
MTKGYVLNNSLSVRDIDRIIYGLERCGFTAVLLPFEIKDINPTDDVAIVGLPAATEDLVDIEDLVARCVAIGIRIVILWLSVDATLPPTLGSYGAAAAPPEADELGDILGGAALWLDPVGIPRPKELIPRNKC